MCQQRGETDFFTGEPLRSLSTLVYSGNVDLQRSASLTFAEITERGSCLEAVRQHDVLIEIYQMSVRSIETLWSQYSSSFRALTLRSNELQVQH